MLQRLLIGTALSGLIIPVVASAESAALGPVPSTSSLQHPAQVAPSVSSQFIPFQPRISVNGALGSDRSLAITEGWAPLWQDDFNVFYGDIRAMVDDRSNEEYNLGFGYRALRGSQIGGLHAWLDKRDTSMGSTFYQATIGAELLTYDTDLRFNMYIPITGTKHHITPNIGSSTPYLAGSGIFYDMTGILAEEPQKGLDLEAGYRLPVMQQYVDAFRVYGGGYAFLGNESDDVVGLRARTQVDVNPWLSIGARFQRDDERGSQGFLEATLRFPIESKKMIQREGVRARMDESPERDVDIVTGAKQVDTGLAKPVINTNTGQVQRVLYMDNSKVAGDGTKENPYNNLKTAEAALQAGDILYVFRGDGTTTGQDKGIILNKDNVSLIGSGVNFIYDAGKFAAGGTGTDFSGTLLLAAGAAPVITNTDARLDDYTGNGVLIRADAVKVVGVRVDGALGHGIYAEANAGDSWESVNISNNTVINSKWYGVFSKTINGGEIASIVIDGNNVSASQTRPGISLQVKPDSYVENYRATNNTSNANLSGNGQGMQILVEDGELKNAVLQNNTTNNNVAQGIFIQGSSNGLASNILIDQNHMSGNGVHGIQVFLSTGAVFENLEISNNISNSNIGSSRGIYLQTSADDNVLKKANISNNIVNQNASFGLDVTLTRGLVGHLSITDNESRENALSGIRLNTQNSAVLQEGEVIGNITNNNVQHGLHISTAGASEMSVLVEANTSTANASLGGFYYGAAIDHDGTGSLNIDLGGGILGSAGGNRIYGNIYRDIFIDSRPGTAAATFGTIIAAQHNWWGVGTGLNQPTRAVFDNGTAGANGSRIDTVNWLTVDPGL